MIVNAYDPCDTIIKKTMVLKNLFHQILRNIVYYIIYSCGLIFTAGLIFRNVKTYYNYSSQMIQTEVTNTQDEVILNLKTLSKTVYFSNSSYVDSFKPNLVKIPNLMICTDSMHSKEKVRNKYPKFDEKMVQQLYGLHTTDVERRMWKIRNSVPELFEFLRESNEAKYTELGFSD